MSGLIGNILNPWTASKIPSLLGKVAVITGGNEGIAAAYIAELLKHEISKVFIVSNDAARHKDAKAYWQSVTSSDIDSKVTFHEADLGHYQQITEVADRIIAATDRIDILNCSAAIGMYATDVPDSVRDKSHAIDRHFACNNVGHAVLTHKLLPLVKKTADRTGDARILYMASNLHFAAPKDTNFDSVNELHIDLGPTLQYNRSKFANVLYVKKLARMLKEEGYGQKLFVNCAHPGVVKTAQQDGALETYGQKITEYVGTGAIGQVLTSGLEVANHAARFALMKDSPEGALSALFATTSPQVKDETLQGEYIVPNGHVQEADSRTLDESLQDRCFNLIQLCIDNQYENAEGADHQSGSTARGSATI